MTQHAVSSQIAFPFWNLFRLLTTKNINKHGHETVRAHDRGTVALSAAQQQVTELVRRHRIVVTTSPSSGQWAQRHSPSTRARTGTIGTIALRHYPVRSATDYAVALHEIGHLVSPRQQPLLASDALALRLAKRRMYSDVYLLNELDAWRWAREQALYWTAVMRREEHRCLQTYASRGRWYGLGVGTRFDGSLKLDAWFASQE